MAPDGTVWKFLHFEGRRLAAGEQLQASSGSNETALIFLAGNARACFADRTFEVTGRQSVWERRPPTVALMPPGCTYEVQPETDLELVVVGAEAKGGGEPRLLEPSSMLVEQRGEGQTLRQVHHLVPPSAEAERLILVEVYTPAGNWSSFPPHKHDTDDPPRESYLEEIYYFHIEPTAGFALQRIYTADGTLDDTIAAKDQDLVLVPKGYHVVAATPGHECYYLNAMAGIGRAWNFSLDPAYAHLLNWAKPPGT